jgi:hypothetical protein
MVVVVVVRRVAARLDVRAFSMPPGGRAAPSLPSHPHLTAAQPYQRSTTAAAIIMVGTYLVGIGALAYIIVGSVEVL